MRARAPALEGRRQSARGSRLLCAACAPLTRAVLATLVLVPPVIPQAASAQQSSADTGVLDEVVVTGSRLEQRKDEAVVPVVVLDATLLYWTLANQSESVR